MLRDPTCITGLRVPTFKPMELMVEASPRRTFANAHTYHINSISVNSDQETYMSADDLRINLWHLEITDQSFSILCTIISSNTSVLTRPYSDWFCWGNNMSGFKLLFFRVCRKMIFTITKSAICVLNYILSSLVIPTFYRNYKYVTREF